MALSEPIPPPPPLSARVWEEAGIVFVEYPTGARIDRAMAESTWERRKALLAAAGKQRHRVVMIGSRITAFDYGAYRFSASRQVTDTISAAAIVCSSTLERHISSIFINMWRPSYPVRLFDSRESAVRWLSGFTDD